MPIKAKVRSLPAKVRAELEQLIVGRGYSDYRALSGWLERMHKIKLSPSTLCRHGKRLESKLEAIRLATEQAEAIVKASPDDEGALNDALIRLVQERVFKVLLASQDSGGKIDIASVAKSVAQLARASVAQKTHEKSLRQQVKATAASVEEAAKAAGTTKKQATKLRCMVLGIADG